MNSVAIKLKKVRRNAPRCRVIAAQLDAIWQRSRYARLPMLHSTDTAVLCHFELETPNVLRPSVIAEVETTERTSRCGIIRLSGEGGCELQLFHVHSLVEGREVTHARKTRERVT